MAHCHSFFFGYDPLECPNCKQKMELLELYYNHKRVSLEELYERAMSKSFRKAFFCMISFFTFYDIILSKEEYYHEI
ncbi:MAG: hypothetical protein ACLROG_14760 [Coprococcus phoceensis]